MKAQLITLDGPVAVGKSSVGSLLAKRLSYIFFDTGTVYRAFTWKTIKAGVSPENGSELCRLAGTTEFDFIPDKEGRLSILVDGHNITDELFSPQIEESVPSVARIAGVRHVMVSKQREVARRGKIIMAGRDIGTVVLPEADLKVFLTAPAGERAKRRYRELLERGENPNSETVLADLRKRDEFDIHRPVSPLKPADDAIIIDTGDLSQEEVIDKIYALVLER
ncbi:MAG: (d)CMP kinase [Dehalococcoidia bacterium]|nr:(d)CMP kinase [Dehalococcoidia bacterium]